MPNDRHVLLLVSGNTFDAQPWDSSTAGLWLALAERFDEVHVFARSRSQRFVTSRRDNVQLHLIPRGPARMMTFLVTSWLLPLVLRGVRPTAVQAQSALHGGLVVAAYCRLRRIPFMVDIHGEHYLRAGQVGARWNRWVVKPLSALTYRRATRIRALSMEMAKEVGSVYGPEIGAKVVVLGNRVDLERFSPPKVSYALNKPPRLICVGALNDNKNQVGLVRDLGSSELACRLVLVGDGPARDAIREAAEESGVEVVLTGRMQHDQLVDLLRDADIYVHYSRSEAVSRAVLEAMAMGLPVVAAPGGFLDGIVNDGRNGIRLRTRCDDELAAALRSLLGSEDLRRALGGTARETIEHAHEWVQAFDRHAAELKRMQLSQRRTAAPTIGDGL